MRIFNKLYGQIDFPSLTNIEEEVNALRQVVPQADILTNEPLTKQAFLEMIQQGKLADYQCLHFALTWCSLSRPTEPVVAGFLSSSTYA